MTLRVLRFRDRWYVYRDEQIVYADFESEETAKHAAAWIAKRSSGSNLAGRRLRWKRVNDDEVAAEVAG